MIQVEDPSGKICDPNKMEDVNLKVFKMIKGINEPKTFTKNISCECRCEKWNNNKCQCECKNQ